MHHAPFYRGVQSLYILENQDTWQQCRAYELRHAYAGHPPSVSTVGVAYRVRVHDLDRQFVGCRKAPSSPPQIEQNPAATLRPLRVRDASMSLTRVHEPRQAA